MKTIKAVAKGVVLGAALIAVAVLVGCAPKAFPVGPNPLDFPGDAEPTVSELHAANVRKITGNPVHP